MKDFLEDVEEEEVQAFENGRNNLEDEDYEDDEEIDYEGWMELSYW